jgi:hypothetical protein
MRREEVIHFDAPPVRRPMRGATVRQGSRGEFSVLVWVRTEGEAEAIAQMINERLGRKLEAAEGVEP